VVLPVSGIWWNNQFVAACEFVVLGAFCRVAGTADDEYSWQKL